MTELKTCVDELGRLLMLFDSKGNCLPGHHNEAREQLKTIKARWRLLDRPKSEAAYYVRKALCELPKASTTPGVKWMSGLRGALDTLQMAQANHEEGL